MIQGTRASRGAFICQRCGRAVRLRGDGAVGALQCGYCGGQHEVGTHATDRERTRIEVESGDDQVFGPNYGFE